MARNSRTVRPSARSGSPVSLAASTSSARSSIRRGIRRPLSWCNVLHMLQPRLHGICTPASIGRVTQPPEVLAVGETMVLVAPALAEPLETATDFHLDPGGAEANVASHLAALGRRAAWAGTRGRRRPRTPARGAARRPRRRHDAGSTPTPTRRPACTSRTRAAACATTGAAPRPRAWTPPSRHGSRSPARGSCTSAASPPRSRPRATPSSTRCSTRPAAAGVPVSFDVNHRPALWPSTDAAARRLRALAARADLVFVGLDEAAVLWGTETADDVRALLPDVPLLVVKDGAIGATGFDADGSEHVPGARRRARRARRRRRRVRGRLPRRVAATARRPPTGSARATSAPCSCSATPPTSRDRGERADP